MPGSQVPSTTHSFFGKKELPGRTLDFEFDFSLFVPVQQQQTTVKSQSNSPPTQAQNLSKKSSSQIQPSSNVPNATTPVPPLNLINLHSNKQFAFLNQYFGGLGSGKLIF